MQISRLDPAEVDLDLADRLAALDRASLTDAGLEVPPPTGPSKLTWLRHGNTGRPVDALWVAGPLEAPLGWAVVELPFLDNLSTALVRATVAPEHRRAGWGSRLLELQLGLVRERGRTNVRAWTWAGTDGVGFLAARGFSDAGQLPMAVRRLDLHEAINDAPADEGVEPDVWDADRVRAYDASMVDRRQTTYRVLARHRPTGEWAGMSLLCVDEFSPSIAHQEDTNVVRAHRGHRLGLALKCELATWLRHERPEVQATDTWNAVDNHHMIAVNERLGCRDIATGLGYRRRL